MSTSLDDVRKEFARIIGAHDGTLNVYAYPEPQPEYPAARVGFIDTMLLHQSHCREGVSYDITLQLLVSDPDIESATQRLEAIIAGGVIDALEDEASTVWSSMVVTQVRNFRQLDEVNGLLCDVVTIVNI